MTNFISTQTAILLSFLLKKMPNLFNHIVRCSTELKLNQPQPEALQTSILSTQQIQEARAHPNTIVLHALNAVAAVHTALTTTNNKLNKLTQQYSKIENILVKLMAIEEEAKETQLNQEG